MNKNSSNKETVRPLRQRFKEAVSEAILDATEAIVGERGVHDAAMSDIAARAGVAVGTVYNYFPDRDGLVRALFEDRRKRIRPLMAQVAAAHRAEPLGPRLRGVVAGILAVLEEHRAFVRLAIESEHLRRSTPAAGAKGRPVLGALYDALREVLADAAASGELIAAGDVAVDRLARMLLGSLRGMALYRLENGGSLTEDAALLAGVFLEGAARAVSP